MSADYFAPVGGPLPVVTRGPAAPGGRRPAAERSRALLAGGVALALLAVGLVVWRQHSSAAPVRYRLQLPATVAGYPPAPADVDFGQLPGWVDNVPKIYHGHRAVGGSYQPEGQRPRTPLLNVVIVNGDASGQGDLALAGRAQSRYGRVSCTRSLKPTDGSKELSAPGSGFLVCWRTTDSLSVSILGIGKGEALVPIAAGEVQRIFDAQVPVGARR